jgi:hypothetical protein
VIRYLPWLLIGLALAGCSDSREPTAKTAPNPIGQWQVTQLNGQPIAPQGPPITLSIGKGWMQARSQCVWWHWNWTMTAPDRFSAKTAQFLLRSEADTEPTPVPMCARGLTPQETAFAKAVDGAQTMAMPDSQGFSVTGVSGGLAFTRRPGLEGQWSVAAIDSMPLTNRDHLIQVVIDDDTITAYSQCVWWRWRYRADKTRLTLKAIDEDIPICERSRTPTENTFERAMTSAALWNLGKTQQLRLQGAAETVTLVVAP